MSLLLFLLFFSLTTAVSFDTFATHAFDACQTDAICTQAFYIDDGDAEDYQLFYFIFRDLMVSVNETLGFDDVPLLSDTDQIWSLWLGSRREFLVPVHCDINHILIYDLT